MQKEPIELVIAKGRKHLTKEEIERRRAEEIKVPFTDVRPPDYLTDEKSREEFQEIADKLVAIGIFTELDVDTLAQYVINRSLYLKYTALLMRKTKAGEVDAIAKAQNIQDKAFRQCRACARDLGLTISSRCRLTIPEQGNEEDLEL